MKNLSKSIFVLAGLSASLLFTSCKKDETTEEKTYAAPTVVVNDGVHTSSASLSVDTIAIKIKATADPERKIVTVKIDRQVTTINGPESPVTIKTATYSDQTVELMYRDGIKDAVTVDEGDKITYTVTAIDDKGKSASDSTTVKIESMATSPQIYIGGPTCTANDYHFFGTADGFRRYRAGSTGVDLAKDNSDKVDFLYFYNSAGSVGNAIYSPDYAFSSGTGWYTETSSWPSKNKTKFKLSSLTSSQFDALNGSTFMTELSLVDFSLGTVDRLANLSVNQVFAYQKGDGKRGFIKVGNVATSDGGQILFIVKTEL